MVVILKKVQKSYLINKGQGFNNEGWVFGNKGKSNIDLK